VNIKIKIGDTFGSRVVLERANVPESNKQNARNSFWLVRCVCGATEIAKSANLRRSKTCKKCRQVLTRKKSGDCAFNSLYLRYKHGATSRNLCFDLTKDQFEFLIKQNCKYCNRTPNQISKPKRAFGGYVYSGVDRIDNDAGYVFENCVPCCGVCNRARGSMSLSDFENWINQLVGFRTNNGR
jgi:hypothetical protein